jgi:uncharacterized membrane protein
MIKNNIGYAAAALFVMAGAVVTQPPKTYAVSHTEPEWGTKLQGLSGVQNVIHQSNVPANVAFWADSVLTSQQNDIYAQVMAAKNADTTGKAKGGKP